MEEVQKTGDIEAINNDLKRLIPGIVVYLEDGLLQVEPPADYPYDDFTDEDLETVINYIDEFTIYSFEAEDFEYDDNIESDYDYPYDDEDGDED